MSELINNATLFVESHIPHILIFGPFIIILLLLAFRHFSTEEERRELRASCNTFWSDKAGLVIGVSAGILVTILSKFS